MLPFFILINLHNKQMSKYIKYYVIKENIKGEEVDQFETNEFDQKLIQDVFDRMVKTSRHGDIIWYGKEDNHEFSPHMFTVENMSGVAKVWKHRGQNTLYTKYRVQPKRVNVEQDV